MAEMEIDDFVAGTKQLNMEKFARQALDAASSAGGQFIEAQKNSDCATWTADQWDQFIWRVLSAGIMEAVNLTDRRRQEMIASVDEIPY